MNIKPLSLNDIDTIHSIASVSFTEHWRKDEFAFFVEHPAGFSVGLFDDAGVLLAYFFGLLVQGDLDVVTLATAVDERRKGYGEYLLSWILHQPEIERVFLEVATTNTGAIALYEKLGFTISGVRQKYYQGKVDAVNMKWEKNHEE